MNRLHILRRNSNLKVQDKGNGTERKTNLMDVDSENRLKMFRTKQENILIVIYLLLSMYSIEYFVYSSFNLYKELIHTIYKKKGNTLTFYSVVTCYTKFYYFNMLSIVSQIILNI